MKLENLDRAVILVSHRKKLEAQYKAVGNQPDISLDIVLCNVCAWVDRKRYLNFLNSEIQAVNLELHNLGVELPGVPTIKEAKPVTKGQDQ